MLNTAQIVKRLLEKYPETRDDDYLLWCNAVYISVPIADVQKYMRMPFCEFMERAKYMDVPSYETVSRARRKLQAKYPELRATEETQAARLRLEENYRKFARSIV